MNPTELKVEIIRSGKSVEVVANEIKMSPASLYRKINGESDFRLGELKKIKNSLNLTLEDMIRIFFADGLN